MTWGNFVLHLPTAQHRTLGGHRALLHNLAGCCLDAITDAFLVYVQSDIVDNIHGVLLIEISEPAAPNSRSQHRNLEENPFSFASKPHSRYLYIQTDEITTIVFGVLFIGVTSSV